MEIIEIENLKCGGCVNSIKTGLEKIGMKKVSVDLENQMVKFEGEREKAAIKLKSLGYPEKGSENSNSIKTKAKSYVSCAIGKIK